MIDSLITVPDPALSAQFSSEQQQELEVRVVSSLERVRPYLWVDGGDVELVRIDFQSMVVEVTLLGACKTCSLAPMTLRAGIERAILHDVPEIRRVESVAKPLNRP